MTDTFGFVDAVVPRSNAPRIRQGVISAVATDRATVSVTIAGDSTVIAGVRYVESYSPLVGEAVWIVTDGQDLFVLGSLASIPSGGTKARPVVPFAMQAGTGAVDAPGALGVWVSTPTVSFEAGRFTQPPIVTAVIDSGLANPRYFRISNVTTSGFTPNQQQIAGGTLQSCGFDWIAVQMTATSAAG